MFSLFLNCSRNVLGFFLNISFLAIGSFCGWSFGTATLQYGKEVVYCCCYCCCSWILCSWYCFTVSCRKERNRDRDRYPYTHICIVHVGRCTRAQFFFVPPPNVFWKHFAQQNLHWANKKKISSLLGGFCLLWISWSGFYFFLKVEEPGIQQLAATNRVFDFIQESATFRTHKLETLFQQDPRLPRKWVMSPHPQTLSQVLNLQTKDMAPVGVH
jgi:hypothetical protein